MATEESGIELDALKQDIERLRADLANLAGAVKEAGVERGQQAAEKVRAAGREAATQADQLRQAAERGIESRPLTSVLGAFGIGFLVGLLLERRH